MTQPKRHHYLPRFYLEKYSKHGLLWVYDRQLKQCRRQSPKDTAVETHRYSFVGKNGVLDSSLEALLSRHESEAAPVIDKLETGQGLSNVERCALAAFVALLYARVPDNDRLSREIDEYIRNAFQRALDGASSNVGQGVSALRVDLPQGGTSLVAREQVEGFLERYEEGGLNKKGRLEQMMKTAVELSFLIVNLDWIICHPPDGKAFITSDSPMVIAPPPGWQPEDRKTFGPGTPGTKKLIPLSPWAGLFMYDKGGRLEHRAIYDAQLRQSNIALATMSDRFVIARDKTQLRSLVKAAHLASRERYPRFPGSLGFSR